jgi:AcrR family transcriptional regulator
LKNSDFSVSEFKELSTDPQKIAPDTPSRTQAERTAMSDKAMLDAAIDLILEHGTDKTTLAAIGEKAGYSRGLATYRFGSKAGLYDEVCKSISRHWLDYLKTDVGDKIGIDAMCAALDSFFQFVSEVPRVRNRSTGRHLQIFTSDNRTTSQPGFVPGRQRDQFARMPIRKASRPNTSRTYLA